VVAWRPVASRGEEAAGQRDQARPQLAVEDLLRVLVSVASRVAFPEERLRGLVGGRGKAAAKWVTAYNLCDGARSQGEIARRARLDPGDLSRAISRWLDLGIVFRVGSDDRPLGLYPLATAGPAEADGTGPPDDLSDEGAAAPGRRSRARRAGARGS
jgi:hypothetical protein